MATNEERYCRGPHNSDVPAIIVVTTGCVHEHVQRGGCCGRCRDALEALQLVCTPCMLSKYESRYCPIRLIKVEELV
jgi:hypothetical protein